MVVKPSTKGNQWCLNLRTRGITLVFLHLKKWQRAEKVRLLLFRALKLLMGLKTSSTQRVRNKVIRLETLFDCGLYLITGENWRTQWQLVPTLMITSDGEAEMVMVNTNCSSWLISPANIVSKYVDAVCERLRKLNHRPAANICHVLFCH